MNRINLVKYGFVRWPEEDFSDDGNRFTCYKAGKSVRVSKLVSDGDVYLSISSQVGTGNLPYEVYSKLPHYNAANWKYNGISVATLTDKDLEDFMAACLAYELEYEAAEKAIVYPTLEEIRQKAQLVTGKIRNELKLVELLLSKYAVDAAIKLSPYEWKSVQEYIKNMHNELNNCNPDVYPQTIIGKSYSFDFVKPDYKMEESYWFKRIMEIFAKYCMF